MSSTKKTEYALSALDMYDTAITGKGKRTAGKRENERYLAKYGPGAKKI